ncbi:twin-arginine translocase TatA/TatE family subunit [Agromyces seonyuensis]|uniref:Sec-independent protein translocase protein TatA n=1 Tax=Agromyces seonyuensis TaxID=2662446 RepID=A0A6I4NTQ4_9MICO|nr:twin-arginine translocase TatA/TatE family subunit [Agromyces seonyuensis]MWB97826.1 twin-arginine translocase TatA/TatE family subunit [Agromyces seonyuensis]
MFANLTGWHFLIILVIILLLFGAPKLPALARSLGQSMKILKSEVRENDGAKDGTATSTNPDSTAKDAAPSTADDTSKPSAGGPSA